MQDTIARAVAKNPYGIVHDFKGRRSLVQDMRTGSRPCIISGMAVFCCRVAREQARTTLVELVGANYFNEWTDADGFGLSWARVRWAPSPWRGA